MAKALADRFRPTEALSPAERDERMHRYHFQNLSAKQLRPLINQRFRPILKQHRFRRASETLSYRTLASPYVHFLGLSFSSTFPGRFFVRAGIGLDFLPLCNEQPFDARRVNLDTDCLFTTCVKLSNGNIEFDSGTNDVEASETIGVLADSFANLETSYFQRHFSAFPSPLDRLDVRFVQRLTQLLQQNQESEFGRWGATDQLFVHRLALIQEHLGNLPTALELVQFGLANYDLYALQTRYEELGRHIQTRMGPRTA